MKKSLLLFALPSALCFSCFGQEGLSDSNQYFEIEKKEQKKAFPNWERPFYITFQPKVKLAFYMDKVKTNEFMDVVSLDKRINYQGIMLKSAFKAIFRSFQFLIIRITHSATKAGRRP